MHVMVKRIVDVLTHFTSMWHWHMTTYQTSQGTTLIIKHGGTTIHINISHFDA